MLTVVLALTSAVMYGLSDFAGGVLARRVSVWSVAVVTQVSALVGMGGAALIVDGTPTGADWAWGALAGVGTGIGTGFLYRGLAAGRMGVVAPLSAVGAALIPVAVGVVSGERPSLLIWLGIALALPAIWLVSSSGDPIDADAPAARGRMVDEGVLDGLLAGLGFGLMFSALGQVPQGAGLGPLAAAEATSVPSVVLLAIAMRRSWLPRDPADLGGIVVGGLAVGATVCFVLATQAGLLAVASVLSSLYPAFTVLLAATVLRERIHATQAIGLVLALGAVALVAAG